MVRIDLNHFWTQANETPNNWRPVLYHCGAYDQRRDCFPVLRSHTHVIHIPATSKPIFRFLQHGMYALWYMSLSERFNDFTRTNFRRASAYMDALRHAFFSEVLEKFYAPQTQLHAQALPTSNKMSRLWFSSILFSWAQAIFHTYQITPPSSDWLPPTSDQTTMSMVFGEYSDFFSLPFVNKCVDWAGWSANPNKDPIVRSLYGTLPDSVRQPIDWTNMVQESDLSGNAHGPMAETDEESWRRCLTIALGLLEVNILKNNAEAAARAEDEAVRTGTARAGTARAGTARAGTARAGTARAGTALSMTMEMDTSPPIAGSSKRPAVSYRRIQNLITNQLTRHPRLLT
jgi:hypothetical protein